MEENNELQFMREHWHATHKTYLIGFILSILFTGGAFYIVSERLLSGSTFILCIMCLAAAQAVTQLLCFMHIGKSAKPRWNQLIFIAMVAILIIIVLGTLWVMWDLNKRVMI